MATEEEWQFFLDTLRVGSEQLLILVEDQDSGLGWRLLSKGDVDSLRQLLERKEREPAALPNRLSYNVEEAARLVGVSANKFNAWLKRSNHPVPHFKDGRRIFIPVDMLAQWLREEVIRNIAESEG